VFGNFQFGQGQFGQGASQSSSTGDAFVTRQTLTISQRQVTAESNSTAQTGGSGGKPPKYFKVIERVRVEKHGEALVPALRISIALRPSTAFGASVVSARRQGILVSNGRPILSAAAFAAPKRTRVKSRFGKCATSAGAGATVKGSRLGDQLRNQEEEMAAMFLLLTK
jgi:hypothetical protein